MRFKPIPLLMLPCLLPILAFAQEAPAREQAARAVADAQPVTTVRKTGHVLFYDGYLSAEANWRVAALIDKDTRILVINSRGGEIGNGMELGELVFDHGLDVEVAAQCFSSCANYVFPAGRKKLLRRHSQVAWHGGATQKMDFAGNREMEVAYQAYIKQLLPRETAFFRKIGVSQASTVEGQRPEYAAHDGCIGWTYSLTAMRQFGMRNIVLKEGGWSPAETFQGRCIFTVKKRANRQ